MVALKLSCPKYPSDSPLFLDAAPHRVPIRRLRVSALVPCFLLLVSAVRAVPHQEMLDRIHLLGLVAGGVSSSRLVVLIQQHGISFEAKDEYLENLRIAGGDDTLVIALRRAGRRGGRTGATTASESNVQKHLARSGQLSRASSYPEAERACRAALAIDPGKTIIHFVLAGVLGQEGKWQDAIGEYRMALCSRPG